MSRYPLFLLAALVAVVSLQSVTSVATAADRPAGTVWSYGQWNNLHRARGAQVTAKNVATGRSHSATADSQGNYVFGPLPNGTYRISASYKNPNTRRTETGVCGSQALLDGRPPFIAYGFNINTK